MAMPKTPLKDGKGPSLLKDEEEKTWNTVNYRCFVDHVFLKYIFSFSTLRRVISTTDEKCFNRVVMH